MSPWPNEKRGEADAMPVALQRRAPEPPREASTVSLRGQLRELYEAHYGAVRAFLTRLAGPGLDPEDLTHEVFLVAWKKLAQFGTELPGRAWLMAIAIKVAVGARRRGRVRQFLGLERAADLADRSTPVTEFEKGEASRVVYSALESLSEKKRTVFVLFELQGFTGEEIAEMLQCPLKTVWSRLASAREEFAHSIAKARSDEGEAP